MANQFEDVYTAWLYFTVQHRVTKVKLLIGLNTLYAE